MEGDITIKAIVRGRVQGVGFRATVHRHAKILGLVGTVRNLSNGSVEICARGVKHRIDLLFAKLQKEEFPGHIVEITMEEFSLPSSLATFMITH